MLILIGGIKENGAPFTSTKQGDGYVFGNGVGSDSRYSPSKCSTHQNVYFYYLELSNTSSSNMLQKYKVER